LGIFIGVILGQVIGALARPFGRRATFPLAGAPELSSVEAIALGAAIPGRPVSLPPPLAPAPTTQAKLDALTAAVQAQRDALAQTMRGQAMTTEEQMERVQRGLAKDKAQATRVNCPHCGKPARVAHSQYRGALTCPWCKQKFWLTLRN
jgi:nitrite reductase/ring-hydroxylating ferredoxin subunit